MQRPNSGGYTIIEVMLFLAISAIIFVISMVALRGQSASTEFRTSVDQVNQQLQQWIDYVQNGLTGNSSGPSKTLSTLQCNTIPAGGKVYPHLTTASVGGGTQRGANPSCVYLGEDVLFSSSSTDNTHISAVPVIGLRSDPATGDLSTSISSSNPIAALPNQTIGGQQVTDNINLSETFHIPNGTQVTWAGNHGTACATNSANCSYLIGFFYSPSASGAFSGNDEESLLAVQYPYYVSDSNLSTASVADCISLQAVSCNTPPPNLWAMPSSPPWQVCLQSTRNDDWATITLNSANGYGASTSVKYGRGTPVCA